MTDKSDLTGRKRITGILTANTTPKAAIIIGRAYLLKLKGLGPMPSTGIWVRNEREITTYRNLFNNLDFRPGNPASAPTSLFLFAYIARRARQE